MNKIRKNDKVRVISGKDSGQESVVELINLKKGLVTVKDVNQVTKHYKKSAKQASGGRLKISKPLPLSNVMLVCGKCGKATRVGFKVLDNREVRVCKKCGEFV